MTRNRFTFLKVLKPRRKRAGQRRFHGLSFRRLQSRLTAGLEQRGLNPDYKGLLLGAMALFFFLAASNTMAGWLYVMSGISVALLAMALYLTRRSLQALQLVRSPLAAVSAGQLLRLELTLLNPSRQAKSLLQLRDELPPALGPDEIAAIALVPPGQEHRHTYSRLAQFRGCYDWESTILRSAAPLGLFWYRRSLPAKARVVVHPPVFALDRCPLVDELGQEQNPNLQEVQRSRRASEGLTRALRPYRWGDPIRQVHWRTSARYGELRVRELETLQAGQAVILALDSAFDWQSLPGWQPEGIAVGPGQVNGFEQAAAAAVSLYRYASRSQERVQVWTAATGLVNGDRRILQTLAAMEPGETSLHDLPNQPLIWLTQNPDSLALLPPGSRWILWPGLDPGLAQPSLGETAPGLRVNPEQPLALQLQSHLSRAAKPQPSNLSQNTGPNPSKKNSKHPSANPSTSYV